MRLHSFVCAAAIGAGLAAHAAESTPDARVGEKLFVGETRLKNGGAPCLGCHAIAGHGLGLAGSASFGPDLSDARTSYDAAALDGLLADVQFPSMEPVYRGRALTPEERGHVAAFLLEPRAAAAESGSLALALRTGAVALVLLGIFYLVSRRRMPPLRDALRARLARASGKAGSP